MSKRYSVYRKDTDMPVVVYGTAQECASALGVKLNTFYHYVYHRRNLKKYEIFEDELEELE